MSSLSGIYFCFFLSPHTEKFAVVMSLCELTVPLNSVSLTGVSTMNQELLRRTFTWRICILDFPMHCSWSPSPKFPSLHCVSVSLILGTFYHKISVGLIHSIFWCFKWFQVSYKNGKLAVSPWKNIKPLMQ